MYGHDFIRDHRDAAGRAEDGGVRGPLMNVVSAELLARLAQRLPAPRSGTPDTLLAPAPEADLRAFCDALVAPDPTEALEFFDLLRQTGKTVESLCFSWIAAAARRLGERWTADDCSFLEVTLGATRLHGMQRRLQPAFAPASLYRPPELSALFAPAPCDTHMLGVTMAADFFRRAGWRVDLECAPDIAGLCARAATGGYRLIGLSASCQSGLDSLEDTVQNLRQAAPGAKIVLGGRFAQLEPDISERISVDHVVTDVISAPLSCQTLVVPDGVEPSIVAR